MRFCPMCGTCVDDDMRFCPECGAQIEAVITEKVIEDPVKPKKPNVKLAAIIAAAIVFLGGIAALVITHSNPDVKTLKQADGTISEMLNSDDYKNAELSERINMVGNMLDKLSNDGIVKKGSVDYDKSHMQFEFYYGDKIPGFIYLGERDAIVNGYCPVDPNGVSVDTAPHSVSYPSGGSGTRSVSSAIILNAFGSDDSRGDFYDEMTDRWAEQGISTTIDSTVTVEDLRSLGDDDMVVLATYGSLYQDQPVLFLNEVATESTDRKYSDDLANGYIAKSYCGDDGLAYYWVFPEFFTAHYDDDTLEGTVFYSESSLFFGCDCCSGGIDRSFSDALIELNVGAVIGYHNSVDAQYSRDVMNSTVLGLSDGMTPSQALRAATDEFGESDGFEDLDCGKREAYPVLVMGTGDADEIVEFTLGDDTAGSIEFTRNDDTGALTKASLFYTTYYDTSCDYVAEYNDDGLPVRIARILDGEEDRYICYEYDDDDRLVNKEIHSRNYMPDDPSVYCDVLEYYRYEYDDDGLCTHEDRQLFLCGYPGSADPCGVDFSIDYEYDDDGILCYGYGEREDDYGTVHYIEYEYDDEGRLVRVTNYEADYDDGYDYDDEYYDDEDYDYDDYDYDDEGDVWVTTYEYDDDGNLIFVDNEYYSHETLAYEYDEDGNIVSIIMHSDYYDSEPLEYTFNSGLSQDEYNFLCEVGWFSFSRNIV